MALLAIIASELIFIVVGILLDIFAFMIWYIMKFKTIKTKLNHTILIIFLYDRNDLF
jgi:hypothetical protein